MVVVSLYKAPQSKHFLKVSTHAVVVVSGVGTQHLRASRHSCSAMDAQPLDFLVAIKDCAYKRDPLTLEKSSAVLVVWLQVRVVPLT